MALLACAPRARGPRGERSPETTWEITGPRLGPRDRDEPVGRLRVRQEGPQLEEDPAPLLPPHQDRDDRRRRGQGPAPGRQRQRRVHRRDSACGVDLDAGQDLLGRPRRRRRCGCAPATARTSAAAANSLQATGGDALRVVGKGAYRGSLIVVPRDSGGLYAINSVPLEAYLRGVVPNEMPADWPAEALRAQAVAARSYALATADGGLWDQYDDTRSQVYGGISSETQATNQAVEATARQGRQAQRQGRDDLLLLDLRRADREHRVLVRRRRPEAVPEVGQGPVRRARRRTTAGRRRSRSRRWRRGSATSCRARFRRSRSRSAAVAADRVGEGRRQRGDDRGQRPGPPGAARPALDLGLLPQARLARARGVSRPARRRDRARPGSRGRSRASRSRTRRRR